MCGRMEIRWETLEQIALYIIRLGLCQLGPPPLNIFKIFPLISAYQLT
jgi:hypothetical protein